jgi:hypothetical protein
MGLTMKIKETGYKDIPAIKVETEKLEALFLPEYGGKCASLRDKKNGREFLQEAPGAYYKRLAYDGNYISVTYGVYEWNITFALES